MYFKFEVLKPYIDNPQYDLKLDDYSGSLEYYVKENTLVDKKGYYKLSTFGLGKDQEDNRVIVSFPRYLRQLSISQQNHWEAHELTKPCKMLRSYRDNIMLGSWSFPQSISRGILHERSYINNLWRIIFGESLFKNDYSPNDLTREYPFLFIPTAKALNKFILLMDTLFSDDMNTKHLRKLLECGCQNLPPVKTEYDPNIGSLNALELWMDNIYTLRDGKKVGKEIVSPFKEIRKEDRQLEAHKIVIADDYNLSYYDTQIEIFEKVYDVLKKLRIILLTHSKANGVKPPEEFRDHVYLF